LPELRGREENLIYAHLLASSLCQVLFETKVPVYGSYSYSKMADSLGLGTNVVFGVHERANLRDKGAEVSIH